MNSKYYILTLGCQMNKSDSERLVAVLQSSGFSGTEKEAEADLIVINSCAVRQSAMDRIYGKVEQWQSRRRQGSLKTLLTGCVLEFDKKKLSSQFDWVLDIREINTIPTLLGISPAMKVQDYFDITPSYNSRFQAFVPIMTGCDKFCTYCAVPYTRGREISRPVNEILKEIKNIVAAGGKEITLLGQNVNSYSGFWDQKELIVDKDKRNLSQAILAGVISKRAVVNSIAAGLPVLRSAVVEEKTKTRIDFAELLQLVAEIPGKFWIRFLTSHPYDMSDSLIATIARNEKICKYVHLPVQAGDDQILKKMNRHYSIEHYRNLIYKVRKTIPEVAISTDIIVGFCSETNLQFEKTASLMRELEYDMAYLAQYSPREGTVAAHSFPDDVLKTEKIRREKALNEILKVSALKQNQRLIGRETEILVDEVKENPDGLKINLGKNQWCKTTKFLSARSLIGDFVRVKIISATPWGLEGELI